ncbi:hypothetical protein Nepgr_007634 [Nepenthes gracilis]|uniref:Zinc finger CCCH domain-containing protein 18-like n=1 Tax=Nepenthes gracilis TaxID=150966 RepID=A0AAD3S7K2_NEPGR|nr:hypothetical protein Nepgr_007634 [Nepenthes gracilis]
MDFPESTKTVLGRIQKIEPANATKIMGYLFCGDNVEQEMIRLAFGPECHIHDLIQEAKLGLESVPRQGVPASHLPSINPTPVSELPFPYACFSPMLAWRNSSLAAFRASSTPYWEPCVQQPTPHTHHAHHPQYLSFEDQVDSMSARTRVYPANHCYREMALVNMSKTCHYYSKGFCKHGSNCRYWHGHSEMDNFPLFGPNSNEVFSSGYLKKLEVEITEMLKSMGGNPISIASLPMLYYEKYGRNLQAEGYLTESQRHGRAGYSLTKLLAGLKSITLIDRPHGQHSIVLVEDAAKYNQENHSEKKDFGLAASGSRQIYLTFPADSTFSEEDVSNYFSSFGHVENVRIPCQQKRMFGFVTFSTANTVQVVLAKGNPHFVCQARVLVKPYREKSKFVERRYLEKNEHSVFYWELEPGRHPIERGFEAPRFLRRQLMEGQEHALELERGRLSELRLGQKHISSQPHLSYAMEELNNLEDHSKFTSFNLFNLPRISSTDDKSWDPTSNCSEEESEVINLPESPFSFPIESGISTVS